MQKTKNHILFHFVFIFKISTHKKNLNPVGLLKSKKEKFDTKSNKATFDNFRNEIKISASTRSLLTLHVESIFALRARFKVGKTDCVTKSVTSE